MKEVTAYQDNAGRLHKRPQDAIESDFIAMVQIAWAHMPNQDGYGDPVVIARILASHTYRNSRVRLREALAWFDEHTVTLPGKL